MNNVEKTIFNDAQLHVLNMMSRLKTEAALNELKDQLVLFYAKRIDEDMEELWTSGIWNEDTLKELSHTHLRTPYK